MKKNCFKKLMSIFLISLLSSSFLIENKSNIMVVAAVSTPKVSIVSLEHMPFLEGDKNEFYIAANNYNGKVQYQLFYNCKTTMGDKWQLIKNSDMVNGWTGSSQAQEPIKVDLSALNLKSDYYRFAIRVRRYGVKGIYSNTYGDYDYAYPFSLSVAKSGNLNLNGDIKINKNEFTEKESMKIDGVKNSAANVEYKLHLYDVKNDSWITDLTDYTKNIDYDLSSLSEGAYIVDVWAKTTTSTNKYDGWKLSVINVKKETTPTVDLVSLDHSPFVEGDNNAFYLVSKNYTGKVQYQLFYTCEATMGSNWELINTEEMTNGWTSEVNASEPLRVNISSLNLKGEKYRFAIRVRRVGFEGVNNNQYGNYDNVYPFNLSVETQNAMKLNEEMLIDKDTFAKNDQLIIKGVKAAPENTQYRLHLYDVKNNKWLVNLTEYRSGIDYDLSNIPEGTYILNIWAKSATSSNKYDGWKLKVININSDLTTLYVTEDITDYADKNTRLKLPTSVIAYIDGVEKYKAITWDSEADTKNLGIQSIEGAVLGGNKKVRLTYLVNEPKSNTTTTLKGSDLWPEIISGETSHNNISNENWVIRVGDWIYYNSAPQNGIYKIKVDGTSKTKITDVKTSQNIGIKDSYIYYCSGEVYKINTNGKDKQLVSNQITGINYHDLGFYKDSVYFTSEDANVYKYSLDGTKASLLTFQPTRPRYGPYIWGNMLFYTNYHEYDYIYTMNLDTNDKIKMNGYNSSTLNIYKNSIYFLNNDDNGKIYRTIIGGITKKISDDSTYSMNIQGEWIYYSNKNDGNKLYKMRVDGTKKIKIADDTAFHINIIGDWIFYQTSGLKNIYIYFNKVSTF
jgi:hypothetical protein